MEPHLLLLHVVRLVEDLGELVVQLDDLDLEPVHLVLGSHLSVIFLTMPSLDLEIDPYLPGRLGLQTQIVGRLGARRHGQFAFVVGNDLAEDLRLRPSVRQRDLHALVLCLLVRGEFIFNSKLRIQGLFDKKTIFRVSKYLFRYRALFGLTLSFAILMTLLEISVPLAIQSIFNQIEISGSLQSLWSGILIIGLLYLSSEAFNCLRIRVNNQLEQKVLL